VAAVLGVSGLALEARIAAGADTRAICTGDGRALSIAFFRAIAADCRGLVSFGVAGGLAPGLSAGTCVVGSMIRSRTTWFMTDWNWSQNLLRTIPGAVYGPIVGVSVPIAKPETKRALHVSTGALAVDMESHVVASVAAARALPVTAVRVITDSALRELPPIALAAMRADGTIDVAAVIRTMIKEPSEIRMLLQTAFDAVTGLLALLRCRQVLGPSFALPDERADAKPNAREENP
jgi:adenosylhomocysteine nucleosidase